MAKRELSTTLKNLKFMQRGAVQREEKPKKEEEEVKPVGNFFSPGTLNRKCVVVMEGDPHPGAIKGRMSFQSFNPSIDKLNEEATSSGDQSRKVSHRETKTSQDEAECSNIDKMDSDANGDLKRKHAEVVTETQYPNKSPKSVQDQQPSPNNRKGSHKQKRDSRPDWSVLRQSKSQNK